MIKAKVWKINPLKGAWLFTRKIDGVRALWDGTQWLSRANKPLYNMPEYKGGAKDVEVFYKDFAASITLTRTQINGTKVPDDALYGLEPLDERLIVKTLVNPTVEQIEDELRYALERGDEGLILRQGDKWLKVKPNITHDVKVIGVIEGKGKHAGKMGALITPMGKVGTGFTDKDREIKDWMGKIIEVESMQLTPYGKFRHPRFIRERPDKA